MGKVFYQVQPTLSSDDIPRNHLEYGYEFASDFASAIRALHKTWRGRTGEQVDERKRFVRLRFLEPDGRYVKVWMPTFLIKRTPPPLEELDSPSLEEKVYEQMYGYGW